MSFYLERFCLVVLTMLASILVSSAAESYREACSSAERYPVSLRRLSQYCVSLDSLRAMLTFERKSALDCACSASDSNAPIAVPLRTHCLDKINSFFVTVSFLYIPTMLMAKLYAFANAMLFMIDGLKRHLKRLSKPFILFPFKIHSHHQTFNFQRSIFN